MRQRFRMALLLLGVLGSAVLAGCIDNSLLGQIDTAERWWENQAIDSYRIEVSHGRSTWHYQIHTITVRENKPVEWSASCVTAPMETALGNECEVEPFDPKDYMVPGLFARARRLVETYSEKGIEIDFDDTYSFPSRIRYAPPDVVDGDQAWRVTSFEPLDQTAAKTGRMRPGARK